MDLRTLVNAELKSSKNGEYVLGVDVARSQSASNNQCFISVLKIKRNKDGKIIAIHLVNIINIPSSQNFKVQAQEVMRIRNIYNAKAVCVDGNGVGQGLIDNLVLEQIDPHTGERLGCWKTMNTDQESETSDAEEILYNLKSQTTEADNGQIILNFIDMIDSEKIHLLEKRADTNYDLENADYMKNEILPYLQTDYLLEEIANLKLKTTSRRKLGVEQQTKTIGKDRYSSLAYGLWYIKNFEDGNSTPNDGAKASQFFFVN